jgi:ribonuclease HI
LKYGSLNLLEPSGPVQACNGTAVPGICSRALEQIIYICNNRSVLTINETSPLACQCQQALNDISARHAVGLFWVPGQVAVRGNEIADKLAMGGSAQRFVGPEPVLGVSRQNIRK